MYLVYTYRKSVTNSLYCDDTDNPLYSGTFGEVNNNQYTCTVENTKYQEHKRQSCHIYETISEKQDKGQKQSDPDYSYIDSIDIRLPSDKRSGTIKSEDFCTTDEENTVYNINYSRAMPPASKPTDTHETHSETSTGKHLPVANQYSTLDPSSRNTVSQYQRRIIQSADEQLLPRKQDAPSDVPSNEAEAVGEYEKLKHFTT